VSLTAAGEEERRWALNGLRRHGADAAEPLRDGLAAAADQPGREVRLWALRRLGELGAAARQVGPAVRAVCADPDREVRLAAFDALLRIDTRAAVQAAAGVYAADLASPVAEQRAEAANALAGLGADARPAVPQLAARLRDDPALVVRLAARDALRRIDPSSAGVGEEVVARFVTDQVAHLRSNDRDRRRSAAEELGKLGPKARAAVPALLDALSGPFAEVRQAAAAALERIEP